MSLAAVTSVDVCLLQEQGLEVAVALPDGLGKRHTDEVLRVVADVCLSHGVELPHEGQGGDDEHDGHPELGDDQDFAQGAWGGGRRRAPEYRGRPEGGEQDGGIGARRRPDEERPRRHGEDHRAVLQAEKREVLDLHFNPPVEGRQGDLHDAEGEQEGEDAQQERLAQELGRELVAACTEGFAQRDLPGPPRRAGRLDVDVVHDGHRQDAENDRQQHVIQADVVGRSHQIIGELGLLQENPGERLQADLPRHADFRQIVLLKEPLVFTVEFTGIDSLPEQHVDIEIAILPAVPRSPGRDIVPSV